MLVCYNQATVPCVGRTSQLGSSPLRSNLTDFANPWEAHLLHLHSQLEEVVKTGIICQCQARPNEKDSFLPLTLGLGLVDVVAPYVDTMPTN